VLLHQPQGGVTIAPLRSLDTYACLRFQVNTMDQAHQACIDKDLVNPNRDQGKPEQLEPLVTGAQLAEIVAMAQKGFARNPPELLVIVKWPDQVTIFLVSCEQLV
jgi:hypothetical protein